MKQIILFSLVHFIQHQFLIHKALIIFIFIGFAAGLVAQMLLPGRGFGLVATIGIGMAGEWLGNKYLKVHMTMLNGQIYKQIAATLIATMILALVINLFRRGKDRDKTSWQHN